MKTLYRTTAIVLSCIFLTLHQGYAKPVKKDPAPSPQPRNPIACGIIIGLGIAGIYIIYKLCQKLPAPAPPAPPPLPPAPPVPPVPPPPTPPTNTPPTNMPPIILPGFPPIILLTPPSFASTGAGTQPAVRAYDSTTTSTSMPPSTTIYFGDPNYDTVAGDDYVTNTLGLCYADISSFGWVDAAAPTAGHYVHYLTGKVPPMLYTNATGNAVSGFMQSSTDMTHWSNFTYEAWVSVTNYVYFSTTNQMLKGVLMRYFDGQGVPVLTNYTAGSGSMYTCSNQFTWFQLPVGTAPRKFYRLGQ